MNERIRQLAEQAFFDEATAQASDKMYTFSDHKMQKFAELIVRECAKVINADIESQIKDGIISNVHGLNQARNLIKQHFGVEE